MRFVVCLSREGFGDFSTDDLTLGRLYEVLAPADSHGMLRIIDDPARTFFTRLLLSRLWRCKSKRPPGCTNCWQRNARVRKTVV
jgi:hypothetical protein